MYAQLIEAAIQDIGTELACGGGYTPVDNGRCARGFSPIWPGACRSGHFPLVPP